MTPLLDCAAKIGIILELTNFSQFSIHSFGSYKKVRTFATAKRKVAQLVAHYVRDVGVGRSSRLFPTVQKETDILHGVSVFLFVSLCQRSCHVA